MNTKEVSLAESRNFEEFRSHWKLSPIIERKFNERISKEDVREMVLRRSYSDSAFKNEMINNARFVWAIIVEEAFGIHTSSFLSGIMTFRILQETADQLCLKVPSCHRGCMTEEVTGAPEGESGRQCHVCGAPKATTHCGSAESVKRDGWSRRQIENKIIQEIARNQPFGRELELHPLESYVCFAKRLCSGRTPKYLEGVKKLTVVYEGQREMCFVLPTEERFAIEHEA